MVTVAVAVAVAVGVAVAATVAAMAISAAWDLYGTGRYQQGPNNAE